MEAVRIIKEMREATNGVYPRFAIWENVPGAFSSNNGNDFRAVLEEITEAEIPMPKSGRWAEAGMVRGNGREVAWRVLDAQYWGVPQRRKRIFLVADFAGECAGEILFERQGMSGNIAESGEAWEEVATCAGDGAEATSGDSPQLEGNGCLTPWDVQSKRIHPEDGAWPTLYGGEGGGGAHGYVFREPSRINCQPDGITGTVSSKWAKGTGGPAGDEHYNLICQTLMVENHPADSRVKIDETGTTQTLTSRMGTGGGNVPMLMQPIAFNGRQDPVSGVVAGALDICSPQAQCIAFPDPTNTLLAKGNLSYRGDVDTVVAVDVRNLSETEELSGTLQSKSSGGYSLNYINPIRVPVRSDSNDEAEERNAREILRKLWQEIGTEALSEWGSRMLNELQQETILRQRVHEGSLPEQTENRNNQLGNESHTVTADDTEGSMSRVWKEERSGCSPQGQRLHEQRTEQSNSVMQELPQLKAQASEVLYSLWRSNEGVRLLQQALYSVQEIRKSNGVQDSREKTMQDMWGTCQCEETMRKTLYAGEKSRVTSYRVRRLSPTETLRLQGFPDDWLDIEGSSDSAKYKAVGNSVAVPCVDFIFSQIMKVLNKEEP